MKRTLVALAVAILVLSGLRASAAREPVAILGASGGFSPATVTVQENDSVEWRHRDPTGDDHSVKKASTGSSGSFDWAEIVVQAGQSASIKFTAPGTYEYVCGFHSSMQGTVIVEPGASPPSPTPSLPLPAGTIAISLSETLAYRFAFANSQSHPPGSVTLPSSEEVVTGSVTIDQTDKGGRPVGRIIAIVAGIVLVGSAIGLWLLRKTPE